VPSCNSSTTTLGSTTTTTIPTFVESFAISSHMLVFNSCKWWWMWHNMWLLRDNGQNKKIIFHNMLPLSNRGIFIINSSKIITNYIFIQFTSMDLWPLRGLCYGRNPSWSYMFTFVHIKIY
jgi:hypothetical protein